jgi:cysteine desulfurase/selenocysteine lyase
MNPFQFGGDMIKEVHEQNSTWNDLPWKFEAGTPNIADTVAFFAAIEYLENIGLENILEHDQRLKKYALEKLSALPGIELYGPKDEKKSGGIVSFNIPGVHSHDIGSILNEDGIAIRTGHHCTQPLMEKMGVPATARMSFYIYNSEEDVDMAFESLQKVYEIFKIS